MRFGADVLAADPARAGSVRRLGLVTNDAARLAADPRQPTRAALCDAGLPIVRLFSPEHGLNAAAPDGAAIGDAVDPVTGLPVVSLYGERLGPPADTLADLDGVLFDVPDVGARFYTYAWTLTHVMDACGEAGVPVRVLDRPNPVGGELGMAEGPMLEPRLRSFLGRASIPLRHGLTLGELGMLWRREQRNAADVDVIPCIGWSRRMLWHATGLPWVPTSPAILSPDAALLYSGLCLFEATNVSVGRGSPLSFTAAGAPWLDAAAVLRRLGARELHGIRAEEDAFTPDTGPHAGERCRAVRIAIEQPDRVRPVALGIALFADVAATHPQFEPARYPTAANPTGEGHLERLLGNAEVAAALVREPGAVDGARIARWTACAGWSDRVADVLLYE